MRETWPGERNTEPNDSDTGNEGLLGGEGPLIANRYALIDVLGRGAYGEVWRAKDRIRDQEVAIKILHPHIDDPGVQTALSRAQLEILALRQQLPGVVEFLDEGMMGDLAFFVMELVRGKPFPGRPTPCAWDDISEVVVSLLATLAQVHAAFLIHRDLKPANVLVTDDGEVKLLDFGIAYLENVAGSESTGERVMAGTPAYMPPEQLQGGKLSEASDIYALGIMLYEALTGQLPHGEAKGNMVLYLRLNKPFVPLLEMAPNVPPNVARLIERMMALSPTDRPATATDVLNILRGENAVSDPELLWRGPYQPLNAAIKAAQEGRSLDVVGPKGTGKTRVLLTVRQELEGVKKVYWLSPTQGRPCAIDTVIEMMSPVGSTASPESREERLVSGLNARTLLLVDDYDALDEPSREVIEKVRPRAAIIRSARSAQLGAETVHLAPLSEDDLRRMIAGPDRLLHLQTDAARILYERTEGIQSRVVSEVASWLRLGVAKKLRNLLVVSRGSIDRLTTGLLTTDSLPAEAPELRNLGGQARDVLIWATLLWRSASLRLLTALTGLEEREIEGCIEELVRRGFVRSLADERLFVRVPLSQGWDEVRTRNAHARIAQALEAGSAGRLHHIVLGGARNDQVRLAIAREAIALSTRLIEEGHVGSAVLAIEIGLRAARDVGIAASKEIAELFALWAEAAFETGTPQAVDSLLHALYRAEMFPNKETIENLAKTMKIEEFGTDRALLSAQKAPPQEHRRLERLRISLLVNAARLRQNEAVEDQLLDDLLASNTNGDPIISSRIDHARGRLRYRQHLFSEAASLHERVATMSQSVLHRVEAMNAGTWALIEAFELDQAEALALRALSLAKSHRHATHETSAEWSLRAIAYRKGTVSGPDTDLAASVPYAAGRHLQAAVLFMEAAIAWRTGSVRAWELASDSCHLFAVLGEPRGALLARCLLVAVGDHHIDDSELFSLRQTALSLRGIGIALQALALLAIANKLVGPPLAEDELIDLMNETPQAHWQTPVDVLSVEESINALRNQKSPSFAAQIRGSRRLL